MAANDEFPRGFTQNSGIVISGGASVQYPACPGVSWVLESIAASGGNSGLSGSFYLNLEVNGIIVANDSGYSSEGIQASASWEGQLQFPQNTEITIAIVDSGSLNTLLTASAYPL